MFVFFVEKELKIVAVLESSNDPEVFTLVPCLELVFKAIPYVGGALLDN